MRAPGTLLFAAAILALCTADASAQVYIGGGDSPHGGSFELAGGGAFASGFDMGSETATLTRSTSDTRFDLFTTESRVDGFPGLFARAGLFITRAISIEGGVRYARPKLSARLTGDAESAPNETATETATHYVFDGSVLFHLTGLSFGGGRGLPFLSGGGGYLRELHEKNEVVETGREYHATAGLKYWFGGGDHRFGLRVEAGLSAREKGFDNGDERRTRPMVLGGLSYLF
jgi:hypothetical protein